MTPEERAREIAKYICERLPEGDQRMGSCHEMIARALIEERIEVLEWAFAELDLRLEDLDFVKKRIAQLKKSLEEMKP